MRITIIATGSRGDVQPYVALGQGLRQAGHDVCLVTTADFAALATAHGVPVRSVGLAVQDALRDPAVRAAIEGGGLLASFRHMTRLAREAAAVLMREGLEAARGTDVLLAGFGGLLVAASLAEALGVPFIPAYNVPVTPTGAFPGRYSRGSRCRCPASVRSRAGSRTGSPGRPSGRWHAPGPTTPGARCWASAPCRGWARPRRRRRGAHRCSTGSVPRSCRAPRTGARTCT
jgi:UDP:flavonoid glycosyltransferase YjiC (YdhE family)